MCCTLKHQISFQSSLMGNAPSNSSTNYPVPLEALVQDKALLEQAFSEALHHGDQGSDTELELIPSDAEMEAESYPLDNYGEQLPSIPPPFVPVDPNVRIDVFGWEPRNVEVAKAYCIDGCSNYVLGIDEDFKQLWQASVDDLQEIELADGEEEILSDQNHKKADIMDSLLIEVFSSCTQISDYDLIILAPCRTKWEEARAQLKRRLFRFLSEDVREEDMNE